MWVGKKKKKEKNAQRLYVSVVIIAGTDGLLPSSLMICTYMQYDVPQNLNHLMLQIIAQHV